MSGVSIYLLLHVWVLAVTTGASLHPSLSVNASVVRNCFLDIFVF